MKCFVIIFSILILLCAFFNLNAQENGKWEILNEGGSYRTIDFINDQVGWIAGEGTLLKTEDGGDTWNFIEMDSLRDILKIDFVNETIGWAIIGVPDEWHFLHTGIIKTEDGGRTWFAQKEFNSNNESRYELTFNAINDTLAYASGYDYQSDLLKILKTSDGGTTWNKISPYSHGRSFNSIWFQDTKKLIFLGKTIKGPGYQYSKTEANILRTYDGGITWFEKIIPEFDVMYDLQIINDSTAYFLASKDCEEYSEHFLCTTSDSLNSWSIVYKHPYHYSGCKINSFYCLDDKIIFAIMSDSTNTKSLQKSTDGGLTWEKKQTNLLITSAEDQIYFRNVDTGFVVGENKRSGGFGLRPYRLSFFSKSSDGGRNWIIQKMNYPALNDVHFVDKNIGIGFGGWLLGCHGDCVYAGDLFLTNDAGKTWEWDFGGGMIKSSYFVDAATGFFWSIGFWSSSSDCYKTNDAGKNWIKVYENNNDSTGYSFSGNDVSFINQEIGWAAGKYAAGNYEAGNWDTTGAALLGTSDGGENWGLVWKYPDIDENSHYKLNSIQAIGTEAWAVGENGLIVKYTEQGQWQVKDSINDLPLTEVFFYDQQHGWITGGYYDEDNVYLKLFKTNDSGQTWQDIPDFNYHINDIFFADSLHGWAVGNDTSYHCGRGGCTLYSGIMLETHDGGNNWSIVAEGLIGPLNAIHFKDGYGWAVGGNGLVLRTEDGSTWIDQKNNKVYPSKFELSQNYPNPFNLKTVISYQLPAFCKVGLSIYNIIGQKVTSLVSEKQPAGTYKVEWDASGFASGIYLYQLKTDKGFIQTKKLVLLK